jgi:uncharacterized RDD family membrane protein YckC
VNASTVADVADEPVRYVGFWVRVAASLIDTVLVLFVIVPIMVFLFGNGWAYAEGAAAVIINWVLPGAAFVAFWIARGATPGKMAFSAVVVDASTHETPGFWQALTRYVGYFVSTTPLFIGLVWVAFDARKQGWHDKMARTVVIYRRR